MARKNYSAEVRRQAVDLDEFTPGATFLSIAEDLGIVRGTLRHRPEAENAAPRAETTKLTAEREISSGGQVSRRTTPGRPAHQPVPPARPSMGGGRAEPPSSTAPTTPSEPHG